MALAGPPAYAWDWFARQRLLWRETRSRLVATSTPAARRYAAVDSRAEVVPLLRADYPRDPLVRAAVDAVVRDVGFLGRTDAPFAALGVRTPPRGMRWWWTALTGEELDGPAAGGTPTSSTPSEPAQLTLDEQLMMDGQLSIDDRRTIDEHRTVEERRTTIDERRTMDDVHEGYG